MNQLINQFFDLKEHPQLTDTRSGERCDCGKHAFIMVRSELVRQTDYCLYVGNGEWKQFDGRVDHVEEMEDDEDVSLSTEYVCMDCFFQHRRTA
jgi:DNA-directed RNA polymerase subunit RPC12/RpoP